MPNEARDRVAYGIINAWPDDVGLSADVNVAGIADAAIAAHSAYLWEQAERPEVVEAVAESWNGEFWGVYRADEPAESREYPENKRFSDAVEGSVYEIDAMHMAVSGSSPRPNELHDMARAAVTATLTALIGPKPGEITE